jgi:hypothetical protein
MERSLSGYDLRCIARPLNEAILILAECSIEHRSLRQCRLDTKIAKWPLSLDFFLFKTKQSLWSIAFDLSPRSEGRTKTAAQRAFFSSTVNGRVVCIQTDHTKKNKD